MTATELLAPAGDMARLRVALAYGADAVYLGGLSFGMRAFAGNFSQDELYEASRLCRARGVRLYVTVNTMPRCDEIARLPEWLEVLEDAGVSAVIVADLGAFRMAERYAPHVRRHISTQVSVCNHETARAWYELGASRVILARELSLDEIREIRSKTPPELELEAFVHGAMCVSYSGRCLLSNYLTGSSARDSGRGSCAQPCRYRYYLMEETRPGEYYPVLEDEKGSYILSSRDMCMIDHIPDLLDAGLSSLKIEGRAKSAYYTAIVTGAYRHAVDAAIAGTPLDPLWRGEVEKVSHRHYSTGFYYGEPGEYTADDRYLRPSQICAVVESCGPDGTAQLSLRNKYRAGDTLELIGPDLRPAAFAAPAMEELDGTPLLEPRAPRMRYRMKLPYYAPPLSILRR